MSHATDNRGLIMYWAFNEGTGTSALESVSQVRIISSTCLTKRSLLNLALHGGDRGNWKWASVRWLFDLHCAFVR